VIGLETQGSGEALVLLHGVGTHRSVWRRAAPALARGRLVAAADLPGFGESTPTARGFELDEVADLLAEGLIERVEPPFDLLGNSLGGAVAVVLASRHPQLVRRLVLSAPALFAPRNAAIARAAGLAAGQLIDARRVLGAPLSRNGVARYLLLRSAISRPERLSAEDARLMLEASRGASRIPDAIASVLSADLRPRLAELDMPLGVIWGERDSVIAIGALDTIRELAPAAAVERMPDVGHVPQLERPREFAAAVERVLGRLSMKGP
jgi:pimeloyl-ACP methyl ester carboxylesterase